VTGQSSKIPVLSPRQVSYEAASSHSSDYESPDSEEGEGEKKKYPGRELMYSHDLLKKDDVNLESMTPPHMTTTD
jgi:hypothetical protein